MTLLYLLALLASLVGTGVIDHRHRLFLFHRPRVAAAVVTAGVAYFLAWDLVGVALGIFFRGNSPYMTGLLVAPEVPVEEVVFLTLLSYVTMVFYCGAVRWLGRRA